MKTSLPLTLLLLLFYSPHSSARGPEWAWARNISGKGQVWADHSAADADGNIYVSGEFSGTTAAIGAKTLSKSQSGKYSLFLAKLDSSGNTIWAKCFGGNRNDNVSSVTADRKGHLYISGVFESDILSLGPVVLRHSSGTTSADIFLCRLDTAGNVIWAQSFGGKDQDGVLASALDEEGNIYLAGSFTSPYIQFGNMVMPNSGIANNPDVFIAKLNQEGNCLWCRSAAGAKSDIIRSIIVSNGSIIVSGDFDSPELEIGGVTLVNSFPDIRTRSLFICRLDTSGNCLWARNFNAHTFSTIAGLAADDAGNIYFDATFGDMHPSDDLTIRLGQYTLTSKGWGDVLLAKLDPSGNLVWARSFGGEDWEKAGPIVIGANHNLYVACIFFSSYIKFGTVPLKNADYDKCGDQCSSDLLLMQFDTAGRLTWVKPMGGEYDDFVLSLTNVSTGRLCMTGYFSGPEISFGSSVLKDPSEEESNSFIAVADYPKEQESSADDIKIYPNPTTGKFRIALDNLKTETAAVEIFNGTGQRIFAFTYSDAVQEINLPTLSTGVYYVLVRYHEEVFTEKLVKE